MKLSVILLAYTDSDHLFQMTMNCIHSVFNSEKEVSTEIIIIESNKNIHKTNYKFPDSVKVIIPKENFNFHKFLNIGIQEAKGAFIALCNNDLIFHDNWFTEIEKVSIQNPKVLSFSPIGELSEKKEGVDFEIGYKVMQHIKGWCFIIKRPILNKMKQLDENFDFYYADNDYALTLKSLNIKHALVFNSLVEHLKKQSTNITEIKGRNQEYVKNYKIPKYLEDKQYDWLFNSEKYLSGFLKLHNKWGNPTLVYRKNKMADFLIKHNFGFLLKYWFKLIK